uniref:Thrombomodulin n=1 Tax=Anabas testudineus TaxID=64144 RepID=A0A7N6B690_ANATE
MKNVRSLFVVALVCLLGRTGGREPNNGYCIENQCFMVFQDPSDFRTAQTQCIHQGGHLMTVRSSVSQDILFILVGNVTGQFWIGLHRPSGCPEPAAELRGFQWVTKDNNSDFFNWAPTFDSSCLSNRCVSVSKAGDFKWTEEPCEQQAAGYLCESSFSDACKGLPDVAQGESVTYRTSLGFEGEDLLSLPPGSVAIRRSSGRKSICDSGQWLQGPWSCEIHNGGCEFKCTVNSKNVPSCSCPLGQTVNSVNKVTCDVATDDPCMALNCDFACSGDGESFSCSCDRGFQLRQCPLENYRCVNQYGMSGQRCVDDDECASAPCEHTCVNTPGSYKCTCYNGYIVDPKSPNNCQLHCGVEECPAECDPNDDSQCNCPEGYISEERDDGTFCLDIDECSNEQCDQGCENTFGSYVCTCNPGFTLVDLYKCVKSEGPIITTAPPVPHPEPTKQPSAVSVGGLVGIILCAVLCVMLLVFVVHYIFNRREKMDSAGALKAPEGEIYQNDATVNI